MGGTLKPGFKERFLVIPKASILLRGNNKRFRNSLKTKLKKKKKT